MKYCRSFTFPNKGISPIRMSIIQIKPRMIIVLCSRLLPGTYKPSSLIVVRFVKKLMWDSGYLYLKKRSMDRASSPWKVMLREKVTKNSCR